MDGRRGGSVLFPDVEPVDSQFVDFKFAQPGFADRKTTHRQPTDGESADRERAGSERSNGDCADCTYISRIPFRFEGALRPISQEPTDGALIAASEHDCSRDDYERQQIRGIQ
jgi:hypothetical protein